MRELSKKAAEVAIRILDGEKAGDIKTVARPTSQRLCSTGVKCSAGGSARAVCRRAAQLPSESQPCGSAIRGRLRFIIAVLLIQAGLIAVLLREHRRRQFAEVQSRQRMAELAHVNRFSTAGELTASIAHEINQPLGSILTNAETAQAILKSQTPDIAELPDHR